MDFISFTSQSWSGIINSIPAVVWFYSEFNGRRMSGKTRSCSDERPQRYDHFRKDAFVMAMRDAGGNAHASIHIIIFII